MVAWIRWVMAIAVLGASAFVLTDNEGPVRLTLGLAALAVGLGVLRGVARTSVIARRLPVALRHIAIAVAALASLYGAYTLLMGHDDGAFLLPLGAAALLTLASGKPGPDQPRADASARG